MARRSHASRLSDIVMDELAGEQTPGLDKHLSGCLAGYQTDKLRTNLPVPWIWIRALSAAWERYKTEGGPLGRAFGLEGGGQGKSPTIDKLAQMLDERAIARWIGSQLQ